MKKYQAIVEEAFNAYQLVRGVEIKDFTIVSHSPIAMTVQVWLDFGDNKAVRDTTLKLKEGTTWELASLVAHWLKDIDFDSIRESFQRWKELNSDI